MKKRSKVRTQQATRPNLKQVKVRTLQARPKMQKLPISPELKKVTARQRTTLKAQRRLTARLQKTQIKRILIRKRSTKVKPRKILTPTPRKK